MRTLATSLALFLLPAMLVTAEEPAVTLSGPYTHKNLTVFLIHSPGGAVVRSSNLLPLKQAMEQKKVVVYETGQVNELAIENKSKEAVFVQGGDIVKGGQQDRVFTTDMILPARSGRVPIAAFCVEQGRWTKRGAEDAKTFSGSSMGLVTRESKLAVKNKNDQNEVWASVATARAQLKSSTLSLEEQMGLTTRADRFNRADGVNLRGTGTSMQLALEARTVGASAEPYQHALAKILDAHPGAIGCAFAINGELNSADVYYSPALFRQLWPKLLSSISIEAASTRAASQAFTPIEAAAVESALHSARDGSESAKVINPRTRWSKRESDKLLLFESQDPAAGWIHRNYIAK
jgi:hypothetical protein